MSAGSQIDHALSIINAEQPMSAVPANDRSSAWDIFMIVAFVVALFYLVSFGIRYPEYWYAVTLFVIIGVVGILKRVAALTEFRRAGGRNVTAADRAAHVDASVGAGVGADTNESHRAQ